MFWKKAPPAEPKSGLAQPIRAARADDSDHALDALAGVMRSFGSDAFDIQDATAEVTRAECERWAQRITVGEGRSSSEPDLSPELRRDWGGVRRYFSAHRSRERAYVEQTFATLRDTVQTFARCLGSALAEDRTSDERLSAQLGRLSEAVRENDTSALCREAEAVVRVARDAIERRQNRQSQEVLELSGKIEALRSELHQARELATLDPLTQLFNRSALDTHLQRMADLAFLLKSSPCLLMIDIDHFKTINDRHGHPVGDEVLRRVADELVRQFLRREDFVARYGGEEFVVVIPDSTLENARKRADRVRQVINALSIPHQSGNLCVTISVGISALSSEDTPKKWLARADAALYEAKAAGRNAIQVSPFPIHSVASLRPKRPASSSPRLQARSEKSPTTTPRKPPLA